MKQCPDCGGKYNEKMVSECPVCFERQDELQLRIAQSPDTDGDALAELALNGTTEVLNAVMENENTPDWVKEKIRDEAANAYNAAQASPSRHNILVTTTSTMPGYEIVEVLGIVYASKSHTRFKGMSQYERLLQAMDGALIDLREAARRKGGNAIIGVTLTANNSEQNATTLGGSDGVVLAGTAVHVSKSVSAGRHTRSCPECFEPIDYRARKCPHCTSQIKQDAEAHTPKETPDA